MAESRCTSAARWLLRLVTGRCTLGSSCFSTTLRFTAVVDLPAIRRFREFSNIGSSSNSVAGICGASWFSNLKDLRPRLTVCLTGLVARWTGDSSVCLSLFLYISVKSSHCFENNSSGSCCIHAMQKNGPPSVGTQLEIKRPQPQTVSHFP